jgi:hypothetical protein
MGESTHTPKTLLFVVLAFVALSIGYSVVTRLKYGPDEPAHFIYVRSVATKLSPPPISHTETETEGSESSHEGHQPPLYYALMAVPYAAMNAMGLSSDAIWRALRFLNIPLGVLWVHLVHLLARAFFGGGRRAMAATAFVALIPTAPYMFGVINNENLITVLFTWALIPLLGYFRSGKLSQKRAAGLGLLIGLASITKAQGLVLAALFLIALLVVSRRKHYAEWKTDLRACLIVLGTAALVSGWWFVRCWVTEGTWMPHSLYRPVVDESLAELVFLPAHALHLITVSTWALAGYFWTPFWLVWPYLDFRIYFIPVGLMTLLVAIGLVRALRRDSYVDRGALAFLIAAPLLTYISWMRYILMVDSGANLQGRLLLSSAAVFGIVWVVGFGGLFTGERARKIAATAGLALMLITNIAVMACGYMLYHS